MIFTKELYKGEYEKIDSDYIIHTSVIPTWFGKLFGISITTKKKYRGGCTVWYSYPNGNRCSTPTESWLSDVWTKICWDEAKKKEKR